LQIKDPAYNIRQQFDKIIKIITLLYKTKPSWPFKRKV